MSKEKVYYVECPACNERKIVGTEIKLGHTCKKCIDEDKWIDPAGNLHN